MKDKKILILGGTGHLGSSLVHTLVSSQKISSSDIRVFYLPDSPKDSLAELPGIDFFSGNILNPLQVEKAMEGVQWVFHAAGNTSFDPRQKEIQWKINVEGTRNVLEACLKNPAFERLCYISTVNALGLPQPLGSIGTWETCDPYESVPRIHSFKNATETMDFIEKAKKSDPRKWVSDLGIAYFDSKLAAQELVNWYHFHTKIPVVSIYPGTMFGPNDYLIGNGMYLLSLYRSEMPAVLDGGLPLTHILDVAEGCIEALKNGKNGGHYVLTGQESDQLSLLEMTQKITEVLQRKFPEKNFRAPQYIIPKRIALAAAWLSENYAKLSNSPCLLSVQAVKAGQFKSWYSYSAAESDFGYSPRRSFEQAVDEMIDYYQKYNLFGAKGRYLDQR